MKTYLLVITLCVLFYSCSENKKRCYSSFTYFKGNIRYSYYLKFTSSDTVYFYDRYPFGKKGTHYFLLDEITRNELDKIVCKFRFPKDSVQLNSDIEDGTTIAFEMDKKRVMLHGNKGPKEFWNFEETMSSIQFLDLLKPINRNVKFENFDKMLPAPPILARSSSLNYKND